MTDPFAHYGQHPDVNAALAAQEKIDRIEAMREREPEPDLREAVRELAEIVAATCRQSANLEFVPGFPSPFLSFQERAEEIVRQLAPGP